MLFLGVLGVDTLVVGVVGGSAEGCEPTDLVGLGGVEMTPRTPSCSEAERVSLLSWKGEECKRKEEIKRYPNFGSNTGRLQTVD